MEDGGSMKFKAGKNFGALKETEDRIFNIELDNGFNFEISVVVNKLGEDRIRIHAINGGNLVTLHDVFPNFMYVSAIPEETADGTPTYCVVNV